jgi:hypothetical protein
MFNHTVSFIAFGRTTANLYRDDGLRRHHPASDEILNLSLSRGRGAAEIKISRINRALNARPHFAQGTSVSMNRGLFLGCKEACEIGHVLNFIFYGVKILGIKVVS